VVATELPGFEVLSPAAAQVGEMSGEWSSRQWWRCQSRGCPVICSDESELADHYSVLHSASLDLSIPPTVIVPTDNQPESGADSQAEEEAADVDRWPGIACPFAGCGVCIASYPGLVMHHRRAHGVPLPAKQRRAIATVYRARRLDADRVSSAPPPPAAPAAASAALSTPSAVVSGSFICPFSGCGVPCSSRDDLVAHASLCHSAATIKQETDSAPASSQ